MIVTRMVNGIPISFEELSRLQVHNDTIQAIYDAVNHRFTKKRKVSTHSNKKGIVVENTLGL